MSGTESLFLAVFLHLSLGAGLRKEGFQERDFWDLGRMQLALGDLQGAG